MYEFEIKLTRPDFLNDAKKGRTPEYLKEYYSKYNEDYGKTKYEMLAEGCDYGPSRFWYIVPENLVTEADIPAFSGWLCFVERGDHLWFRELKKAPRLHKHKFSDNAKDNIRHKLCDRYWRERSRNEKRRVSDEKSKNSTSCAG